MIPNVDIGSYCIDRFIKEMSKTISSSDRVLDAGAGDCPFKKYFTDKQYESTDIKGNHTFLCDLENIPVDSFTYNVVICTQVLEHVSDPEEVLRELHRILRYGGKLFLSAPQGWMLHGSPNHFFNFTCYGLKHLFAKTGFRVISIESQGGVFWYLNDIIRTFPIPLVKYFVHPFLFHLDKFDRKHSFTLGYNCYCVKGETDE